MTEEIRIDGGRMAGITTLKNEIIRLEQENEKLKKQIESDKGLITVGGKQQYQYLQRIDELEQENSLLSYNLHIKEEEAEHYLKEVSKCRSALEEIRAMINHPDHRGLLNKIEDRINEVLGE